MPASAPVKVAIRTRQTASFADGIIKVDKNKIILRQPKAENPNAQDAWSWTFDAILHNASQETVYTETVEEVVRSVLDGFNGTIMCYGQTGAGKTFTQIGSTEQYQNRGITPRAIADIFKFSEEHSEIEVTVGISYVEIYNETLIDLLSTIPSESSQVAPLQLIEDRHGATQVKNLNINRASTEEEALNLLFTGQNNRAVANHYLNPNSTRGHAIFTVHLQLRSRVDSSGTAKLCKLHLVDLAGSERLKKTATEGDLRSESMYINKSLSYLEQVVVALASKGRSHTPYRQSKLTHLLKDSLGGNCKTLLIANIYGEETHLEETKSTLQFASRVKLVPNEASVNEHQDPTQLIKKYKAEIEDLKRELAMHDSLASRSGVSYEPYSEQQRAALQEMLRDFLFRQTDSVPIESVRQMKELLDAARTLFDRQQEELDRTKRALTSGGALSSSEGFASATATSYAGNEMAEDDCVGEEDTSNSRGIAIGQAPDGARPANGLVEPSGGATSVEGPSAGAPTTGAGGLQGSGEADIAPLGRQEAFTQFKASEGSASNTQLLSAKAELKRCRARRGKLAAMTNAAKKEIDSIKSRLETKKAERESQQDESYIIDEEEYALIQALKETKQQYRQHHEDLKDASSKLQELSTDVDTSRQTMLRDFDNWYEISFTGTLEAPAPAPVEPVGGTVAAEVLDDDEQFEQLEEAKVMAELPESMAFFRARKLAGSRKNIRTR